MLVAGVIVRVGARRRHDIIVIQTHYNLDPLSCKRISFLVVQNEIRRDLDNISEHSDELIRNTCNVISSPCTRRLTVRRGDLQHSDCTIQILIVAHVVIPEPDNQ